MKSLSIEFQEISNLSIEAKEKLKYLNSVMSKDLRTILKKVINFEQRMFFFNIDFEKYKDQFKYLIEHQLSYQK